VELTVTDDDGDSDSTTRNLSVEAGGERTSGMSQYIHEDPEASTSFSTNSNNWQYDIDLDGTGGGGEIMVGTTGGQIDLSDVETVYVDWMLDYGGRGQLTSGLTQRSRTFTMRMLMVEILMPPTNTRIPVVSPDAQIA